MKRYIQCLGTSALLALLLATPVIGQQPTVEFDVVAWGAIKYVSHDCPIDERDRIERYAPDVVTCTLRALDVDSAWTPANFTATSTDPSRVAVSVTDSTLTINILRRAGLPGVRVTIEARPILFLAGLFTSRPDGPEFWARIDTIPPIDIVVGEAGKVCAYQGGYGKATAKGMPLDGFNCPDFGPTALPTFPVVFSTPDGAPYPTIQNVMARIVGPGHAVALTKN